MYTGLTKVQVPTKLTVTIDLNEETRDNLPDVFSTLVEKSADWQVVIGASGNVGLDGRTVGLWSAK